jgi:hypothetical protein
MATLTERRQIPFLAVGFVIVQVVDGQSIAVGRIMRMTASLTFVSARRTKRVPESLCPRRGIFSGKLAHSSAFRSSACRRSLIICRYFAASKAHSSEPALSPAKEQLLTHFNAALRFIKQAHSAAFRSWATSSSTVASVT